ncbi:unnamed protein product [Polarella glacialis]|uniref:C3H1-type domain-containing protein n=1 Tax=Polarella glacialis TaxID=89957 RepID=A0A813I4J2_POLGL|nr:unnamed protein product [Polarella glacialis]
MEQALSDFKLTFFKEERGLRSLQRGWRTPDPSPIRKGLPKCAANIEFLVRTRKDKSEPSSHDEDEDFETRTPEWARIRTPSPDMRDNHYQPCLLPPVPPVYCFSVPGPPWSCLPCNSSSYGRVACGKVADGADLPTPGSSISLASMSTSEEGTEPLLSLGSLGHPYNCATGCKYANKPRGCKDGSACDHCHLCEWRRPPAPIPPASLMEYAAPDASRGNRASRRSVAWGRAAKGGARGEVSHRAGAPGENKGPGGFGAALSEAVPGAINKGRKSQDDLKGRHVKSESRVKACVSIGA